MQPDEDALPPEIAAALAARDIAARDIAARDEVGLRVELERHLAGYTLCRLTPAAARRWKARYRILLGADYLDGQTPAEVYARALLAVLSAPAEATAPPRPAAPPSPPRPPDARSRPRSAGHPR